MSSTRNFWTHRHIHMDGRMEGWTDGPEKKLVKFTYTDTEILSIESEQIDRHTHTQIHRQTDTQMSFHYIDGVEGG